MDISERVDEVSVSSLLLDSINSQQRDDLSPEDLAWADSCLIKDYDISESDWNPLKVALLEIINSPPESFNTVGGGADTMILLSSEQIESKEFDGNDDDIVPLSVAAKRSYDDIGDDEESETLPSLTFQGNPFLPTYSEDVKMNGTIDSVPNLDTTTYEMEHSSDNIFRIWDLDISSHEEGELVEQLNKALGESSMQTTPRFDDSVEWKDDSLDNLIAGIGDLSLNQSAS
ncbi:hypothetical protein L6164_022576 [Bauhinia variegata]|uniref:Uncharacterized protein n=1 Tax=Bauhinia variegata TaxID=167791 RepID=A0ACB9MG23_BAUVA|nr:hypothetical protein L6164_022576 [Bauhinia variegata]